MEMYQIFCQFKNKNLSSFQAQGIILNVDRKIRFKLFITLYYATLNKDAKSAFEVFKEAYCLSDNIYSQIQSSLFKFDLKLFLKDIQSKGLNIPELMNKVEKDYYDNLPECFEIYRGMNRKEHKSKNYGISWSLNKKNAEQYIFFDKNNSEKGGLSSKCVNKKDILTVFNDGQDFEIIHLNDERMFLLSIVRCQFYKILNWKTKIILKYKCGKITRSNNL